jgi:hypothetical protein
MKLDAITLDFARQVIEEETGTPLDIKAPSTSSGVAADARTNSGAGDEAKLIARDDKKNPLISTFDWSSEAAQRILRVPAGFMRNKTQERVEGLARERALTTIDLGLVEEGIEVGKKIMAEVIANYPNAGKGAPATPTGHGASASHTVAEAQTKNIVEAQSKAQVVPAVGSGYLNEVSSLTVPSKPGDPSTLDSSRSGSSRPFDVAQGRPERAEGRAESRDESREH